MWRRMKGERGTGETFGWGEVGQGAGVGALGWGGFGGTRNSEDLKGGKPLGGSHGVGGSETTQKRSWGGEVPVDGKGGTVDGSVQSTWRDCAVAVRNGGD